MCFLLPGIESLIDHLPDPLFIDRRKPRQPYSVPALAWRLPARPNARASLARWAEVFDEELDSELFLFRVVS